jgi:hypothetical protein
MAIVKHLYKTDVYHASNTAELPRPPPQRFATVTPIGFFYEQFRFFTT